MKLLHAQELALLSTLRAERAASDECAREQRLAEAQRWEEYLFTAFDQLTARLLPLRYPHPSIHGCQHVGARWNATTLAGSGRWGA